MKLNEIKLKAISIQSEGKMDETINFLLRELKHKDDDLYNEIVFISGNKNQLCKLNEKHLITKEDFVVQLNRLNLLLEYNIQNLDNPNYKSREIEE